MRVVSRGQTSRVQQSKVLWRVWPRETNDEGGNCAGSAIFGILAKEVFL